MEHLLEMRNLSIDLFRGKKQPPVKLVEGIDLNIDKKQTFGVVGESGSGKTTLCLPCPALSRMQRPAPLHGLRGYVHPFRLRRIHEIPV